VDAPAKLTGSFYTIFQRVNQAGDMVRIATNVLKDGKRAIGTAIPAVMPDGRPNPVVATVLAGKDYIDLNDFRGIFEIPVQLARQKKTEDIAEREKTYLNA
jgi:hypothetical protein